MKATIFVMIDNFLVMENTPLDLGKGAPKSLPDKAAALLRVPRNPFLAIILFYILFL